MQCFPSCSFPYRWILGSRCIDVPLFLWIRRQIVVILCVSSYFVWFGFSQSLNWGSGDSYVRWVNVSLEVLFDRLSYKRGTFEIPESILLCPLVQGPHVLFPWHTLITVACKAKFSLDCLHLCFKLIDSYSCKLSNIISLWLALVDFTCVSYLIYYIAYMIEHFNLHQSDAGISSSYSHSVYNL